MKKLTQTQIKNCIDNMTIAAYCNQVEYSKSELSKALSSFSITLGNLVQTEYSGVDYMSMQHSFKDGLNEQLIVILTLEFKISGVDDKFSFVLNNDGYDKFISSISHLMYLIVEGSKAVAELNKLVHEAQNDKGSAVVIMYKLGISDKFCRVCDWDYNKIKVKLSKTAIVQLIDLVNSEELNKFMEEFNWVVSIRTFIHQFNKIPLHEKINAVINHTDIEKILTDNMLSMEDVVAALTKSKANTGVQEFKSVTVIRELGKFMAITYWRVDYSKKAISIQLMDDKVLDIENDRFISDRDIVDRVARKLDISDKITERIFGAA